MSSRHESDALPALDTLNFSHNEWISAVEQIKRISSVQREALPRRQHARDEALGLLKLVIDVRQPGGTDTRLLARSHDLSVNGFGFIHGMYIHPDSPCTCWLRHAEHGLTPISGTILWCRHISGRMHLSGMQLAQRIRVKDYLP